MTNEQIIFNERVKLMKDGVLKGTGEFIELEFEDGVETIEIPEEIHTFNGWKQRGFIVKKGEKSGIKFPIWKYTEKKPKEETGNELMDAPEKNMFMKLSAFFTFNQVEVIKS